MKSFSLQDILNIIRGSVKKGTVNPIISFATARPRMMRDNTLFFDCYRGNYYDPKDFTVYKSPVIVTETPDRFDLLGDDAVVIAVGNVDDAYWSFARHYRALFPIPVIGVTGTCGKTTTKEMIRHILIPKYKVRHTYKSQNASYLDFHYLIGIDESTDFGVFEMGVLWPGDLTESCRMLKPQIRIILNIGVYHLSGCGTPENYLKAKAEMLEGIEAVDGTLILNADDVNIKKIDVSNVKNIIYFGMGPQSDFKASNIEYLKNEMAFVLQHQGKDYPVRIPGLGRHNVYNALAAIAAAFIAGVGIEESVLRLASFEHLTEHLQHRSGFGGCTVLEDTWSSAPPSVIAGLETLIEFNGSGKKIALIGCMPLLGDSSYALEQYAMVGVKAVEAGVDLLVTAGEEAKEIGRMALDMGMEKSKVIFGDDGSKIFDAIQPYLNEETTVLLKITHRQMVEPSFRELKLKLITENK